MRGHVMVFAPDPQLTVTIDQPADETEIHLHPGGQGVWQARMIKCLGTSVVLCAGLGGEIGQVLEPLLAGEGVDLRVIHRESSSGGYVHDRRNGARQELASVPGHPLTRHELDELYNLALGEGLGAEVSILSGPGHPNLVAPDIYRRLAADLGRNGSRVIADLSGAHLAAVLDSGVSVLKVSHEELIRDGWAADDSEAELVRVARALHANGAESVVLSRAESPALVLIDGEVSELDMPRLEVADPRGAGDSMTAGVAAVLAQGGDVRLAVRTGAAAGALNVTRHGLGTGRPDAIAGLVDRVRLAPIGTCRQDRMTPDELAHRTTNS
ncbi:bifunctional hydroxymethylpyrimidine kinase/phosphomethylpyrimidine kinase [Plantactinospora sp. S1510]|uniref:Bifunctional hydroxymethylpyrimidine kinase/phosphomethylpyrimidine kinase n=2 Tax=Plantactinospora alkalitolerans TaxID=2789879 RepID=A0ABS0H8R8_9ACTN|nr:bifunctional hydroxymethylpyrimidine kinase/phosphomethylpyrimidine kinase [Plantactinospora alkalitolerans]